MSKPMQKSLNCERSLMPTMAVRVLIGKGNASVGIDLVAAQRTPCLEFCWINYCADDGAACGTLFGLELLGTLLPLFEISWKHVGIRHDLKNFRIIGFLIPGNSDDLSSTKGFHSRVPFELQRRVVRPVSGGNADRPLTSFNDFASSNKAFSGQRMPVADVRGVS